MNPSVIQASLNEHAAHANALLRLLEQESELVLSDNTDELNQLVQEKQVLSDKLSGLGSQLQQWMGDQDLSHWLAEQAPEIQASWRSLVPLLQACQTRNDANGMLISRRQTEVARALASVNGSGTYDAAGQAAGPAKGSQFNFQA